MNFPAFTNAIPFRPLTARRPRVSPRRPSRITPHASEDYYKVLDIPRTADAAAVKRAYRRAALKNHPDVSKAPDARDRFLKIQQAYAVLSDSSKRSVYDRRATRGGDGFGFGAGFGGFDTAFDNEYAKQWREKNPMPEDINDNIGSIFSDLFSGVADVVGGSNGIVEDFVDFLEKQVDGFGSNGNDSLKDILESSDIEILQAELDDAKFVFQQLEQRKKRADEERKILQERAEQWKSRAERADSRKEYEVRDAARGREVELRAEAERFDEREKTAAKLVRQQERRIRLIQERMDEVKKQSSQRETNSGKLEKRGSSREDRKRNQQKAIDDELEKMKRELGL